jgi:hypothetical protein
MTPYQYFLAWTVAFCLATIGVWLACELASWVSRWWWRRAYRLAAEQAKWQEIEDECGREAADEACAEEFNRVEYARENPSVPHG